MSDPEIFQRRLDELPLAKQTKLIDRVFVRLNSIYGPLWSAHQTSENLLEAAKAEWRIALGARSLGQIKAAFADCLVAYPNYPPTLGQFDALCRKRHGPWLGASITSPRQALPPAEPLSREEALARMRKAVGLPPKRVDC